MYSRCFRLFILAISRQKTPNSNTKGSNAIDAVWRFVSALFRLNPEFVEIYKNLHNF